MVLVSSCPHPPPPEGAKEPLPDRTPYSACNPSLHTVTLQYSSRSYRAYQKFPGVFASRISQNLGVGVKKETSPFTWTNGHALYSSIYHLKDHTDEYNDKYSNYMTSETLQKVGILKKKKCFLLCLDIISKSYPEWKRFQTSKWSMMNSNKSVTRVTWRSYFLFCIANG